MKILSDFENKKINNLIKINNNIKVKNGFSSPELLF